MAKKIWITKNWENSCTVTIWTVKPVWYPNKKVKQPHDNGYWGCKVDGSLDNSSCVFLDCLNNMFKVKFSKKRYEGHIAERILTVRLPKRNKNKKH